MTTQVVPLNRVKVVLYSLFVTTLFVGVALLWLYVAPNYFLPLVFDRHFFGQELWALLFLLLMSLAVPIVCVGVVKLTWLKNLIELDSEAITIFEGYPGYARVRTFQRSDITDVRMLVAPPFTLWPIHLIVEQFRRHVIEIEEISGTTLIFIQTFLVSMPDEDIQIILSPLRNAERIEREAMPESLKSMEPYVDEQGHTWVNGTIVK